MGRMMNSDIFLVNILHAEAATRCVLLKRCSLKFREIHRNTPVPDPLFLIKLQASGTGVFFCKFCEISKNTFSYRTPLVAASVHVGNLFTYLSKFLGVNKPIKKKNHGGETTLKNSRFSVISFSTRES